MVHDEEKDIYEISKNEKAVNQSFSTKQTNHMQNERSSYITKITIIKKLKRLPRSTYTTEG